MSENTNRWPDRPGLAGYFSRHVRSLGEDLRRLLRAADRDSDPVSITILTEGPVGDELAADGAIVILKGGDTVALFCQWAERNKVLTRGKPIEGEVPDA